MIRNYTWDIGDIDRVQEKLEMDKDEKSKIIITESLHEKLKRVAESTSSFWPYIVQTTVSLAVLCYQIFEGVAVTIKTGLMNIKFDQLIGSFYTVNNNNTGHTVNSGNHVTVNQMNLTLPELKPFQKCVVSVMQGNDCGDQRKRCLEWEKGVPLQFNGNCRMEITLEDTTSSWLAQELVVS